MKKRITALLLCCVMLLTLCPGLISTATAYDDTQPDQAEATGETVQPTVNFTNVAPFLPPVSGGVRMQRAASFAAPRAAANDAANDAANFAATDNGMKISKTATPNDDGSYTITLEAYATGEKFISEVTEDIPTDIILVLDQSGSMAWDMGSVSFGPYSNRKNSAHYANRHNGGNENLYYFDVNSKAYYPVSVEVVQTSTPKKLDSLKNYTTNWYGQITDGCYWYYRDNLYEKVGEEYKPVTLTYDWIQTSLFSGYYQFTYTFSDGERITSDGLDKTPDFGSRGPLYTLTVDENQNVYTYTYVDADGNTQTIGTSTGANNDFVTTLYQKVTSTNGGGSRLEALTTGVEAFANSVATKAAGKDGQLGTDDDVNHRIAVVGFASRSGNGNNTELLSIAGSNSGSVGVAYDSISDQNLKDVLQDMSTQPGQTMVTNAINALAANGATRVDLGMDMAQRILAANPVSVGQRNRVVIVFTDGAPTSSNGFEKDVANTAISTANTIKTGGATVYSVGIFPGANPTSSGTEPSWDLNDGSSSIPAASNWFMQNLSSNNGKVQTPSYYLSAADADTLKNIFQQISDQIESGGSSSTLTADAVVKDIISPQFTLPAGATADNITLETYKYKGPSFAADNAWEKNPNAMGATAKVNGETVSVTGFDFAANYVGTVTENGNVSYRGNKLVISFKVQPKAGFLGGNDVYTNSSAGVYENGSATDPVLSFPQPQVNVPIDDVAVTAADKNVYLLGEVTADQLKAGTEISVGDVTLNLAADATNYGLEDWQTEYVNIAVTVKDKDGNAISDKLADLTEDTTYTVEVTVAPKTQGTSTPEKGDAATAKTGVNNPAANVYVFKPEVTFKDSTAYYGETVPANNDYSGNRVGAEKWMHDGTEAVLSEMLGTKPTLDISYTPDASKISDGKYTKQDVPVKATVKIGSEDVTQYTTFLHKNCNTACGWNEPTLDGDPAFLLHVNTCTLTITKSGCETDKDANQSFIFKVTGNKDNNVEIDSITVTVQENGSAKITGLPVGNYTVTEDGMWSWRYTANGEGSATLSAASQDATVTIENNRTATKWLSGDNYAINYVDITKAQGTFVSGN